MKASALNTWLDANAIDMVRVEATSIDGPFVGKHVSRAKFEKSLPEGLCLADFILGIDLGGTPQIGWWADWRQPALGDMYLRPDIETLVALPELPGVAACLGDFTDVHGTAVPICPRALLRAQHASLIAHGFEARAAFELEFFVLEEPIDEARRRKFGDLTPLGGKGGKIAYLTQRSPEFLPMLRDATARLAAMNIPWEAFNDEAAPGQFELNLAPASPLEAADRLVRAKRVLRDVAYEHGHSVTFMAKPFAEAYGSGLHLHLSLTRGAKPAFGPDGEGEKLMRWWVAGCLATVDGATSILTPSINAFRRQVDFAAVPTTPTWGEENKGAAVRTITRNATLARVEHRVAAADANPYLALAAVIAGGLAGLDEQLEPPPPSEQLPWGLPAGHAKLPSSIRSAADALQRDARLRSRLGDAFIDHWVESRKWEWLMFHTQGGDPEAKTTTPWELERSFEWA